MSINATREANARTDAARKFIWTMIDTTDDTIGALRSRQSDDVLAEIFRGVARVLEDTREAAITAMTACDNRVAALILARALRELLIDTDLHTDAELPKY